MHKRARFSLVIAIITLLAIAASANGGSRSNTTIGAKPTNSNTSTDEQPAAEAKPICDGTSITSSCTVDGVTYTTYVYHAAVPEKSHIETTTTYEKKLTGYCTLCNDGTYSPSCATGRGACSWHGGVQEWNAPMYTTTPIYQNQTIIDTPAQEAYYEKVVQ